MDTAQAVNAATSSLPPSLIEGRKGTIAAIMAALLVPAVAYGVNKTRDRATGADKEASTLEPLTEEDIRLLYAVR